eukprot:TRINITY_DN23438_c0_g1_i1.p1 TRINITY_DN23438_c0_g1~~TRINITY_DN23438_c0_g1_i1.p1  ORF type:complete len:191 (-),score=59.27 TRINITY_DN23438_c0_g1_i1:57-629(-)
MEMRKKTYNSFVGVMVPAEHVSVMDLLSKYYPHSPVLPHITFMVPFYDPSFFEEAVEKFREALKDFNPFWVTLKGFGYFPDGSLWIKPESNPPTALDDLQQHLERIYPDCHEARTTYAGGFKPHVTVGKVDGEIKELLSQLEQSWEPITFQVTEIQILSTGTNKKYQVRHSVALGGLPLKPLFESVPLDQ